jgi:hypothetical protein
LGNEYVCTNADIAELPSTSPVFFGGIGYWSRRLFRRLLKTSADCQTVPLGRAASGRGQGGEGGREGERERKRERGRQGEREAGREEEDHTARERGRRDSERETERVREERGREGGGLNPRSISPFALPSPFSLPLLVTPCHPRAPWSVPPSLSYGPPGAMGTSHRRAKSH